MYDGGIARRGPVARIAAAVALHRWKGQMLLSIAGGTLCCMLLVQAVF